MIDALENPLKFILSPSQQHNIKVVPFLIEGIKDSDILADKGYDDNKFIKAMEIHGCVVAIDTWLK